MILSLVLPLSSPFCPTFSLRKRHRGRVVSEASPGLSAWRAGGGKGGKAAIWQPWRCTACAVQNAAAEAEVSRFPIGEQPNSWNSHAFGRAVAMAVAFVLAAAPIPFDGMLESMTPPSAEAVLYSPDTKVPRSADVALRRAIPAVNLSVKKIQTLLEDIFYLLRIPQRKPYGTMESNVKQALKLAIDEKESMLAAVPEAQKDEGIQLYNSLLDGKNTSLRGLLQAISDKDADKVSIRLANALEVIAEFETIQAPGLQFLLPAQYQQFPRLTGRATVEFIVTKADGSGFRVSGGGGLQKEATIQVALDGYSAPLTAGNFAELVQKGVYNGIKLRSTEQAVLTDNEADKSVGRSLPIEILPAGEFQPLYRTTLSVQDGELPVLPLSVYGALAMAHSPTAEDFSAPAQFFFYLYDKRSAGLGGLSFDEGQFSVFGYVTSGNELLSQLKTGDIISSCRITSGLDRLFMPASS